MELSLSFNHKEGTFELEQSAAKQINELTINEVEKRAMLLSVKPGGCAGFVYEFDWTSLETTGKRFEKDGATLIIKEADLRLIDGGSLKYSQSLSGSKFEVVNPNASSACGCGKSFS